MAHQCLKSGINDMAMSQSTHRSGPLGVSRISLFRISMVLRPIILLCCFVCPVAVPLWSTVTEGGKLTALCCMTSPGQDMATWPPCNSSFIYASLCLVPCEGTQHLFNSHLQAKCRTASAAVTRLCCSKDGYVRAGHMHHK